MHNNLSQNSDFEIVFELFESNINSITPLLELLQDAIAIFNSDKHFEYYNKKFSDLFPDINLEYSSINEILDINLEQINSSNHPIHNNIRIHSINFSNIFEAKIIRNKNYDKFLIILNESRVQNINELKLRYDFYNFWEKISYEYWTTDSNLNLNFVNKNCYRIFGFTPEQRLKMNLHEMFTPQSVEKIQIEFQKQLTLIQNGQASQTPIVLELKAYHSSGEIIDIEVVADFMFNNAGNLDGIQGISKDISERKKTESIIEQSREKYRNLSELLSMSMDIAEIVTWEYDIFNNLVKSNIGKMKSIFGTEIMGTPQKLEDIYYKVHPDDLDLFKRTHSEIAKGNIQSFEIQYRLKHAEGFYKWVLDKGSIVEYENQAPRKAIGILIDKNKEIEYLKRIQDSEVKFKELFNNMTSGFALHEMIFDEYDNPINYKYYDINPAFEKLIGISREQIIGKFVLDVFPNTEKHWFEKYGKVAKTGLPDNFVNYAKEIGKYYEVFAYSPKKNYFATIFNNVTDKIEMQNNLKEYTIRLESGEEISHLGSWEMNTETFEIMPSKEFYNIYELPISSDKLIDSEIIINFIHPEDKEYISKQFNKFLESKSDFFEEHRIITLNGSVKYISSKAAYLKFADKEKIIGSILDITERKQFEKDLINARNKAEESDKLKSAFLANVSHEIRTPMNSIIGFLNLMSEPDISDSEKNQFISIVKNSSKHLLDIINDVIEISKIEAGEISIDKETFDLNKLFNEVLNENKIHANSKGIKLELVSNNSELFIFSDRNKIKQIMTNLVANAIKFTDLGVVSISYQTSEGNLLIINVKDTGIGIAISDQKIIFERFRQIENFNTKIHKGTGLGLSIVKAIVDKMNGDIKLNSSIGSGSEFIISIPLDEKPITSHRRIKYDESLQYFDWSDFSVLIVEDEVHNYILLDKILFKTKIKTYYAENISNALKIIENNIINLVLLDIKLGKESGYDLIKIIKNNYPELPVIGQSAFALFEDIQKAKELGFDSYIVKPISKRNLISEMNKYLIKEF